MSSRPSRVRKEPDTFLPTNFRGNETRKKAKKILFECKMFRRSSRVSTKPETVQMLQENEAKKKSVAKKRAPPSQKIRQLQGKIQKPKPVKTPGIKLFNVLNSLNNKQTLYSIVLTNVQKTQKQKKKLESQFILPYIKKIIDVSPNSPKYIKDGLIYLYSNHFGNDQIIKRSKESLNDIKIRIKKTTGRVRKKFCYC